MNDWRSSPDNRVGKDRFFIAYKTGGLQPPYYLTQDGDWDPHEYRAKVLRTPEDLKWAREQFQGSQVQGTLPLGIPELGYQGAHIHFTEAGERPL